MTRTRVLVVGVGSIGERHLRTFQQTGRAELSLCEINADLRHNIAATYGVERAYASFDEAIESRPDAAVICTPAHLHIPMATKLASAGINLLIEKPLSTSFDGIESLQSIIGQQGLVAGVAYVYRAHPVLTALRDAILQRRFGAPVQLIVVSGQHFPLYRPAYREIYYRDRATGGGAVQDALTHMINAAEWLIGPVASLTADIDHQVLDGVDVEDTVHVIARHGSVQATYSLNQHQAPNETTLTVVCESGTVRFEVHENRWRWAAQPGESWHDEPGPPLNRDDLFIRQANLFLDALHGASDVTCSLSEATQTLRVNLAILEAAQSRSWIDLNSVNEPTA